VSALPLSDVRVLDLTRLLPGGFCSLLLADLGAEVLKVEDTGMGDYIRWAPPYYGGDEQQALGTRSALYLSLNRGKRSIRLDLKSDSGREALLRQPVRLAALPRSLQFPPARNLEGVAYSPRFTARPPSAHSAAQPRRNLRPVAVAPHRILVPEIFQQQEIDIVVSATPSL
jgi:hypothetical protein